MQTIGFYQTHLDRVSRSFAFCIKKLESPLRQWVSLAYLLCRVLDTVEDSIWESSRLREAQYSEFDSFLQNAPSAATVQAWSARFPISIPETEKLLLAEAQLLFKDLHSLPPEVRRAMQGTVQRMSAGMKYYASRTHGGELRLADLTDVNRYCYFVAGIVGELLTKLLIEYRPEFVPNKDFMKNAFHFGLFLQKVNLLKDQRGDEREGRFLVPNRAQLFASLRENAEGAVTYLTSLPEDERGFRTFCAWSLFLGAASLSWIEMSFNADDGSKIPRNITQELLEAVEAIVLDNSALRAGFEEYFPKLPALETTPTAPESGDEQWFTRLSGQVLASSELVELRLC